MISSPLNLWVSVFFWLKVYHGLRGFFNFLLVDLFHGYISCLNISGIFLKSMCCFAYIYPLNISHGHSTNGY